MFELETNKIHRVGKVAKEVLEEKLGFKECSIVIGEKTENDAVIFLKVLDPGSKKELSFKFNFLDLFEKVEKVLSERIPSMLDKIPKE